MKATFACKSVSFALVMLFCCRDALPCAPQPPATSAQISNFRMVLATIGTGEKEKVVVKLRDNTTHKGFVSTIETDSFVLADSANKNSTTIAFADILTLKKRGLSKSAKILIGGGGVWVVLAVIGSQL